ncbi:alpha/beta hydrolase [Salinigranum rubrum]|uniref:Alpha/beta hydrolase n=1 Tax=Salinigranum rubrum TaxID=755307 RepID=A0A2I8VRX4_9EURY|nr:alpha/beta hydrolase family protein [Salinigranum rubrum]AUV83959.1 alpha/beta hydrolase [Salinigranum rubrum]
MDHLATPRVHRLLASPVGRALDADWFDRLKTRSLRREFAVQRARAAADVAVGASPRAYLQAVGAPPAPHLSDRIEAALARYASRREAAFDANERWEDVLWDPASSVEERLDAERERRRAEHRRRDVADVFGFLVDDHLVPPVDYSIPDPETVLSKYHTDLVTPDPVYRVPERSPRVERSDWVPGPDTVEYWLRFPSPSPYVSDDATARVYEPVDAGDDLPTLVFYGGMGMVNDCAAYWPEEAYLGRALAPEGVRVVLPDAPWHGRREREGRYSGEPYLARAPESTLQLYAAAVVEAGTFVDWAHTEGSGVGLGGISLGGIVAMHVAGRCGSWPESARPESVVPVAATGDVDAVLVEGDLSPLVDLDDALRAAGWYARLHELGPLLNPPDSCGLAPERVFPVFGRRDTVVPPHTFTATLDAWGVPEENRTTWETGHFGALLRSIRGDLEPVVDAALSVAESTRTRVAT